MQSCSLAPRSSRAAPGALCAAWQALQEFWPTVAYPPTGGWFATLLALSAWMLVVHPASGFVCPVITRFGSWHAMHNCPFDPSRNRKVGVTLSMACKLGVWQVVQSKLPLTNFTA